MTDEIKKEQTAEEAEAGTQPEAAEAEAEKAPEAEAEGTGDASEKAAETDEKAAEAAESERYMRLMAEFQNYKKRVAKEKQDTYAYANEKLVSELLTVFDNFERGLTQGGAEDPEGYAKGMELIFTQMKNVLTAAGLEELEALGTDFDPMKHNAVMTEDTEEFESGKVCRVMQKGYALNGKVIRPAMVAVAK